MRYGNKIILAAHRGDRKNFPENTMPAFESAVKFGVDMVELDVHMTSDGELVIIHDRNTSRTTGFDGFTNEMTFTKIKELEIDYVFSNKHENTSIPSVKEFIDFIKNTNVLINWELKDYPCEVGDEFAFCAADKLISMIIDSGLAERSIFDSFSDRVLEQVYLKHGHLIPLHGQGIYNCQKSNDKAETKQEELYDWCCLYPNPNGTAAMDYPKNFEYCIQNSILPCVCVKDDLDAYKKYIELGCRMFTSNDIYEADRILRHLKVR